MTNEIIKYTWNQVNINVITNYYLYGQATTPADYEKRLRADITSPTIEIDMFGYMQDGPGRYAHASQAKVVQDF